MSRHVSIFITFKRNSLWEDNFFDLCSQLFRVVVTWSGYLLVTVRLKNCILMQVNVSVPKCVNNNWGNRFFYSKAFRHNSALSKWIVAVIFFFDGWIHFICVLLPPYSFSSRSYCICFKTLFTRFYTERSVLSSRWVLSLWSRVQNVF